VNHRSLELTLGHVKWESTPLIQTLGEDKPGNVFSKLPQPILELLCKELNEEDTFDSGEKIIDNG